MTDRVSPVDIEAIPPEMEDALWRLVELHGTTGELVEAIRRLRAERDEARAALAATTEALKGLMNVAWEDYRPNQSRGSRTLAALENARRTIERLGG